MKLKNHQESHLRVFSTLTSLILFIVFFLYPQETLAHVKWFVSSELQPPETFVPYSFDEPMVRAWIGIAVFLILTSIFLDSRLPSLPIVDSKTRHDVIEIVRILTGMSLLLTAYDGKLIAPHLAAQDSIGMFFVFLEAVIGLMLIANRFLFIAAILLLVLLVGVLIQFNPISALEYINVTGIALFILFNNMPTEASKERFKPYSVAALRIFTGISLVTLGLSEKIIGASLGQEFLRVHQWNFMQAMGLDFFTDRLFVLSAGMMEVVFGTILILGTVTRLNTLVLSLFLLASNLVFLYVGMKEAALMELVGHMPIIASALILIVLGYGQRLKIPNIFKKTNDAKPAEVNG
ncbi:hypothetical protein [Veronia nyctiphanis]|nr:hypothetical protein [Veronia nyctiphanis]